VVHFFCTLDVLNDLRGCLLMHTPPVIGCSMLARQTQAPT
jgi:hypothetical protein